METETAMRTAVPAFLSALMAILPLAAAAAPPEPTWHEFDYAISSAPGTSEERVALLLRAAIDGRKCWLQLDTGAPGAVLWNGHETGAAREAASVVIRIGDIEKTVVADTAQLAALRQGDCGVAGSVGNAFFEHGTLSLDFAGSRFAFTPTTTLASDHAAQPMRYLKSAQHDGHPLLPARLFDGSPGDLLLDTGAARFGLVATSLAQWHQLTGGLPLTDVAAVRSFAINNAIDTAPLRCRETTVTAAITMAGRKLAPGLVAYCEGKEFRLDAPLSGILGLRALARYRITLDYVSQRWTLAPSDGDQAGR